MANPYAKIRKGESLSFVFDRGGASISGWVCTIEVKTFPSDTSAITARVIAAVDDEWPGFLTSTETAGLNAGSYRLIGILTNAATNQEEVAQQTTRFQIGESWAS
tara:strand:- start:6544 stop:6858 length:315 start_codon:yes stop_codon:yes gene_type:complete